MGRHSAPDDGVAALPEAASTRPTLVDNAHHSHAFSVPEDEAVTVRLGEVAEAGAAPVAPEPALEDEAAEPVPTESAPVEPVPAEPVPAEPVPAEPVVDSSAASSSEPGVEAGRASGRRAEQPLPGTRGDLQLLRESPRLRIRCAAAVVVPFLLYTVLLIVIDRTDVYLIWFWIPTVLAGVLIGAFLDIAHRRLRDEATGKAASAEDADLI